MRTFTTLDTYEMARVGNMHAVALDRDCDDPRDLLDEIVLLDGKKVWVRGVECYARGGSWCAGDPIGLLAEQCN